MAKTAVLVLEKVNKKYVQGGDVNHVLQDVDFTLHAGEVVALVGPSGSGKSTFLQIAGLLDSADSGKIFIAGQECSGYDDARQTKMRLQAIGFVYQFHHLLPEFSVLENLIIPQLLLGKARPIAEAAAEAILAQLGLSEKLHSLPAELSGGQQQRVAFARALINNPQLLLADEPTGNLDHENSLKVFDLMLQQVHQLGLAAVIVTHNLEIARKCDKIFSIENGALGLH